MKAILWTRRPEANLMAQVVDRPYIQHVVEQLIEAGVTRIEFCLSAPSSPVASHLGDGTRWGIEIAHHSEATPLVTDSTESVLLGEASCLPQLPGLDGNSWHALFFHDEARISRWTGWAIVPASAVTEFLAAGDDWRTVCRTLGLQMRKMFLDAPSLSTATPKQVLHANRMALEGTFRGLHFEGEERSPGVWVARAVKLPANVHIESPCYIGEETWIGDRSRLGPHAVIGRQCVIEPGTVVCRSVVGEGTYLGKDLEVSDSVVSRNILHNVRWDAQIRIEERHVAGSLLEGGFSIKWLALSTATVVAGAILLFAKVF
jgi:NDP-sugar pyrophosphorylase family protein